MGDVNFLPGKVNELITFQEPALFISAKCNDPAGSHIVVGTEWVCRSRAWSETKAYGKATRVRPEKKGGHFLAVLIPIFD